MKFKTNKSELKAAVESASKAVDSRPIQPILENILISVEGEKVSLTGFDFKIGVSRFFSASETEEGSVAVPSEILKNVVDKLPEGIVHIETDEEFFKLICLQGTFKIRYQNPEEYPALPLEKESEIQLPEGIAEGIAKVLPCVSKEETKRVLTGVNFRFAGEALHLESTDGHRMAKVDFNLEVPEGFAGKSFILPANACTEIQKLLGKEEAVFYFSENKVSVEGENQIIYARLLEGEFPDVSALISGSYRNKVVVDASEFLEALNRAAAFSDKVLLTPKDSSLKIEAENQDFGISSEELDCELVNFENYHCIYANNTYVKDGCKVFKGCQVALHTNGKNQPIVISPLENEGDEQSLYLFMPMQGKE